MYYICITFLYLHIMYSRFKISFYANKVLRTKQDLTDICAYVKHLWGICDTYCPYLLYINAEAICIYVYTL